MRKKIASHGTKLSLWIFYGLLAYMPFHILISTVIGANIGGLAVLKIAKDIVLMFGFCTILLISIKKPWFASFIKQPLVLLIMAYALLTIVLALIRPTDLDAEILGITYNLRFLVFFIYAWLLGKTYSTQLILKQSLMITLFAGATVAAFGIIQYAVLPDDALTHIGFTRDNGVLPAFFIDDKPNLERVMSTLRDPNSLGSYLIIIVNLAVAAYVAFFQKRKAVWAGVAVASLLCLLLTFSRSALLGLVLSGAVALVLGGGSYVKISKRQLRVLGVTAAGLLLVAASGLIVFRNSYVVQNVVFHADQSTTLEDPNELRLRFIKESIDGVLAVPLGSGPGTAGLASIRNNVQGVQLNENYYLQVATEVGIVGLLLFLAIIVLVARSLNGARSNDLFAVALLASFAGLAFTNTLVHIWSNEAVAYTWWGLAGLMLVGGSHFTTAKNSKT